MLKDKDRIFKNLYNDKGADVVSSKARGDWSDTKNLCAKGRDWIINEIKRKRWSRISNWIKMVICTKGNWIKTPLFSN